MHTPFQYIRKDKNDGYWHSKTWNLKQGKRADPVFIREFDLSKPGGVQMFAYNEYRPGTETYPLPGYFAALNDIETDTEISIYNLSVLKNGQFTGKLISFFNGVPPDEKKRELEQRWNTRFNGSGNAGRTMLAFNNGTDREPIVTDLSTTDLDKFPDGPISIPSPVLKFNIFKSLEKPELI